MRLFERFAEAARAFEKTKNGKFWKVDGDPTGNNRRPFLSWIRRESVALKEIIFSEAAKDMYSIFIVIGTAPGYPSSAYSLPSRQRTADQKGQHIHIVDGVRGSSAGPFNLASPDIQDLLDNEGTWMVIDGKQEEQIVCECNVLVVCSAHESNYEELGKLNHALKLYSSVWSVWSREEVGEFLDDIIPSMDVPSRGQAFGKIGGVARHLFQASEMHDGLERWETAIHDVGSSVNVNVGVSILSGSFVENVSDCLVHIFATDNHRSYRKNFASDATITRLHEAYLEGGLDHTAAFLERTTSVSMAGPLWGKLYESLLLAQLSGINVSGTRHIRLPSSRNVLPKREELRLQVLASLEAFCRAEPKAHEKVGEVLKALYDANIVKDSSGEGGRDQN